MTRHPGVRSVGRVVDPKSGSGVDLKLETSRMEFYATVGTETFRDKDGDVVRRKALEALKRLRAVEWIPVIIVRSEDEDPREERNYNGATLRLRTARVDIEARRSYLGKVGRSIQMLTWERYNETTDPELRVERSVFAGLNSSVKTLDVLPIVSKFMPDHQSDTEYILPYDEDTWKGICAIIASVKQSRENLNTILHSKDAPKFLALVGSGNVSIPSQTLPPLMIPSKTGK